MNEPPSSGALKLSPASGHSLVTAFALSAVGYCSTGLLQCLDPRGLSPIAPGRWVDADLPLTYVFGTAPLDGAGAVTSAARQPFGGARANAVYDGVLLPQGVAASNYSVLPFPSLSFPLRPSC